MSHEKFQLFLLDHRYSSHCTIVSAILNIGTSNHPCFFLKIIFLHVYLNFMSIDPRKKIKDKRQAFGLYCCTRLGTFARDEKYC